MQIDLSQLFEKDGFEQELTASLEAERFTYGGETYDFVNKSPVTLNLRHSSRRQIELTGSVSFELRMNCSRCLEPVLVPFQLHLEAQMDLNHPADSDDELPYVRGYSLDVDLLVFDELIINMPISVLCRDDCKGLCLKCGKNLNEGPCGCDASVPDPRMARILDIFNANNKEV